MTLSLGNTLTEKGRFIPSVKFSSQETSGLGTVLRNSDVVSYTKNRSRSRTQLFLPILGHPYRLIILLDRGTSTELWDGSPPIRVHVCAMDYWSSMIRSRFHRWDNIVIIPCNNFTNTRSLETFLLSDDLGLMCTRFVYKKPMVVIIWITIFVFLLSTMHMAHMTTKFSMELTAYQTQVLVT